MSTTAPASELTSSRRERVGWYFYDWANSAFATTVITVFLGPFLTAVAKQAAGCGSGSCAGVRLHPLGIPVAPGAFYAYLVSLSVILTVVVLPIVGAVADRSARKKRLLAVFAYLGAAATIGMVTVGGGRYLLGGALFLVANISLGASVVVYNSFLPQLAGADKRDSISSIGWAIGYLGGGLLLAGNLVAVFAFGTNLTVARWCIVSAGLWWAVFTTVPVLLLRERPGTAHTGRSGGLLDGFRQLRHTLAGLRAYPLTLFFWVAYLIYNDGIQTVLSQASVFATEELKLGTDTLTATILVIQFLAFGGALLLGWLAKLIGAWKSVLLSLVLWVVVVGCAYFVPAHNVVLFVALGSGIGLVMGGSQALSRSLYSQLVPAGREAEYFGLYEIGDKGTSWLGPLLFGLVFQLTGSYRLGVVSLLVFFVAGLILLAFVPMRRAITAAGNTPPRLL
ncbi:MFS transporter [Actinocatenispora sera]|uniref:MFS transporter n=1 Tax=Actinocatenispora sera TaxID=390989 RepID=UPI0033EDA453